MLENIENLRHLNFKFEYQKRLIHSYFDNNEQFTFKTPLLKVLKPIHKSFNKKKNTEKKYIILEVFENSETYNELDDFIIVINKLHEISQENIRINSIKWFNTEFDDIGLDMKVKKPIEYQKNKQFIKIIIPENKDLLDKIELLEKDEYISCHLLFKGLKVYSEYLVEEYEIIDFLTEDELNENNDNNIEENSIDFNDSELNNNIEEDIVNTENIESNTSEINNDTNKNIYESNVKDEDQFENIDEQKISIENKEKLDINENLIINYEKSDNNLNNNEELNMNENKNTEKSLIIQENLVEESNNDQVIEKKKTKFIKLVRRPKKKLLFMK